MEDADQRGQGDTGGSARNMGNGHNQGSHLQFFGQAKKRINDIFKQIGEYVGETDEFVDEISHSSQEFVVPEVSTTVKAYKNKVQGIREVIQRKHMKVAFFGRTSNGKSTVINAMLREKIMPSGIGHTTHCFIQVEGSDSNEAFLLTEDTDQPKSLGSIKQLAHNLSSERLKSNSLIRILWPKEKCRLLREDVVFVDSPGIDVDPDLDSWIDQFCLDADVFVLVANAESTLTQTEKNFFHKVSARLSKPNIFVLQNRWDVSALEEDVERVRQQHMERNIGFFVNELNVVDKKTAEDRVFFVSAREALDSRLHQDKGTPTPSGVLQDGFQMRLFEFANFENTFEQCISKSAVKTKFEQHTQRGKSITSDVRGIMEKAYTNSLELKAEQERRRGEKGDELDHLQNELLRLTGDVKDKIRMMVEEVERKVGTALSEEIKRLSILVEEYDRPFHPFSLEHYAKELHTFVEESLCRNMVGRCTSTILQQIDDTEIWLAERLSSFLPEEPRQQLLNLIPKREFEIAYRFDCWNQEDFSPQSFLGRKMTLMGTAGSAGVVGTIAYVSSRAKLGAVVPVLTQAAGWQVIAASAVVPAALYGLLNLYKGDFKQQYVEYTSSQLKQNVNLISSNCSRQVQQELSSTFSRLCHQADITKKQLDEDLKLMDKTITQLKDISNKAKVLRNKADWLDGELNSFESNFLKQDGV